MRAVPCVFALLAGWAQGRDLSLYSYRPGRVTCDVELPDSQQSTFFAENDFGQVPGYWRRLTEHCEHTEPAPGEEKQKKSMLRCTPGLTFCHMRHWAITYDQHTNYNELAAIRPLRHCPSKIKPLQHISGGRLFNWKKEYDNIHPGSPLDPKSCNTIVKEPTLIIQPDSHANYGHAMCDFTNLFLSMHVANLTHKQGDLNVVVLSGDLSYSRFKPLYNAVTRPEKVQFMRSLGGQTVCYRDAYLAVNPRTFHTFFYNMPVRDEFYRHGCRSNGGFIHTFSEAIKDKIDPEGTHDQAYARARKDGVLRIGLLSRASGTGATSGTRHIVNEGELVDAANAKDWGYPVKIEYLRFDWNDNVAYQDQVRAVSKLDVIVGLHGSGLTHMFFVPRWGGCVELYDMNDNWLKATAAIKGLKWIHGDVGLMEKIKPAKQAAGTESNPKFWNYRIPVDHFLDLIGQAVQHVRTHPLSPHRAEPRDEL